MATRNRMLGAFIQETSGKDSEELEEKKTVSSTKTAETETTTEKKRGRKQYVYANGREARKLTTALYGKNYIWCLTQAEEMGIHGNQICYYINYLIDKDRKEKGDKLDF